MTETERNIQIKFCDSARDLHIKDQWRSSSIKQEITNPNTEWICHKIVKLKGKTSNHKHI